MCGHAPLVCMLALFATPAAAQSTTEDGIRALLGGDYQTAARILRPLADDARRPDPVAQFFLAVLYETGHGVKADQTRACGLFLRSAGQSHPFSEQAAALAAFMQAQWGSGASGLCVSDERWQGGPPQSFVLGPSHRIVFVNTGVTVTYSDQEQRTNIFKRPGEVFPPIRYAPVSVTRPIRARRDFFLWFQWVPDAPANPSSWTLGWVLTEVVGDRWLFFTGDSKLLVVNGTTPPASYDLANLVRLGVNANGEAEFTVVGGASPRTEVIPWPMSR